MTPTPQPPPATTPLGGLLDRLAALVAAELVNPAPGTPPPPPTTPTEVADARGP